MFNRKSKEIKNLKEIADNSIKRWHNIQKENIEDFILILNQIQEFNNSKTQWKHRQLEINNAIDLAREKYIQKIVELEIDPQF